MTKTLTNGAIKIKDETRMPEMKPKIKTKILFVLVFWSIIESRIEAVGKSGGYLIGAFV